MLTVRAWAASALLLLTLAAPSWARPAPVLEKAKQAFEALKYRDALKLLEQARAGAKGSLDQSLEILGLIGQCQVGLGDRAAAEAAFEAMLKLSPNAALDQELSPKILDVFEAAKRHLFAPDYVQLKALPGKRERRVNVVDPWRRVAVVVALRRSAAGRSWAELPLEVKDHNLVIDPAHFGGEVFFYLEARGADGFVLAHLGSAAMPLHLAGPDRPLDEPPMASDENEPAAKVVGASRPLRRWSWLPAGAGLVLLGVGAACDGVAKAKYDQLTSGPPFPSLEAARRLRDEGKALQTSGAVFLGIGAVGLATAGLMYLWPETPAGLAVFVGPNGAWVGVGGAFH